MRRILVTDAARGAAVTIIRSLGRSGAEVIAADSEARSPGFYSRHAADRLRYPSPAHGSGRRPQRPPARGRAAPGRPHRSLRRRADAPPLGGARAVRRHLRPRAAGQGFLCDDAGQARDHRACSQARRTRAADDRRLDRRAGTRGGGVTRLASRLEAEGVERSTRQRCRRASRGDLCRGSSVARRGGRTRGGPLRDPAPGVPQR